MEITEFWTKEDDETWSDEYCKKIGLDRVKMYALKKHRHDQTIEDLKWNDEYERERREKKKSIKTVERSKNNTIKKAGLAKKIIEDHNKQFNS